MFHKMNVRQANPSDKNEWGRMRNSLWPGSVQEHLDDIDKYVSNAVIDIVEVFVLERGNRALGGFIELNVRNYAEGSQSTRVPYVEGWYVDSDLRGRGYGKRLVQAAERWAIENGFDELASDAELGNPDGIAAHQAVGFEEVGRIVCFIKKLG
jgi:aminoglycoside 6'-N-acetyltransferase I